MLYNHAAHLVTPFPNPIAVESSSIAVIGPGEERREQVVVALAGHSGTQISEFHSYRQALNDFPGLLEKKYEVVIIDVETGPDDALELVENFCAQGTATVMVYSAKASPDLIMRSMRAGAREFLTIPLPPGAMAEALDRASSRRQTARIPKKTEGRLLTMMGAKGGAGVTTLACNFAVALAEESGQKTLLIDLDLPLGDAALNLGIAAEYSTIDALQAFDRLDSSFLSKLLVKHSSGVSVLAAPGTFIHYHAANTAIDRLLSVARNDFDNVVIDVGSRLDLTGTMMFAEDAAIYLVTQAGISELRNSNRLISQFFGGTGPTLEIVINRYEARGRAISEEQITKALTRPVQWRIPNDYPAVQRMQVDATPLTQGDSQIARQIRKMARSVTGQAEVETKRRRFSLFK